MSQQPIITVEHFPSSSPNASANRASAKDEQSRRRSSGGNSGNMAAASKKVGSNGGGGGDANGTRHSPNRSRSPLNKADSQSGNGHHSRSGHSSGGGGGGGRQPAMPFESSMGASLSVAAPNPHHVRRKSSPCIGALPAGFGGGVAGGVAAKSGSTSPSRGGHGGGGKGGHRGVKVNSHLKLELGGGGDHDKSYHNRRRLSSPPSFDPGQCSDFGGGGGGGGYGSGGSNHSSGHGSMQQLSIGGLNASRAHQHHQHHQAAAAAAAARASSRRTDIRENTVRSGHQQIGTLYAPNNVTYPPERVSINLVNAPDDSTLQCDCGHINCPLCNLMMNLEMTDPTLLS